MKTSTLIPVVAYLGLAGYTVAAPVDIEATHSLDKRTFCFFGFGWCNTATTTSTAPKSTASSVAPSSSVKAVVTSSSAVKASAVASSSAKVVSSAAAASSAKVVSSAAASSSAKAVVSTSAAVTKTSTANWAQCTDFDWNSWGSDWTWGGGFDKEYVKSWYVAEYGFAPPQGMNWRQVSSLVSKFGQKTKPASPKTTSKYTGKGCANPWTSAVNTKTAAVTSSAKPVVTSAAASKPAVTSAAASSAAVSKASSAAASSASASVAKPSASSASSVVVGGPASSAASSAAASSAAASSSAASSAAASSAAASAAASSAASSAAASSAAASSAAASSAAAPSAAASSAAASSAAALPAASSAASSAAAPAASSAASSAVVESAPAASSAAAVATTVESSPSPAASSSASAAAASPSAGTGSSDGSVGVPGTGSGVPGTGAGSNNATGTATSEAPVATTPAAVVINGFTSGGCVQEVSGRLLEKVQTSSSSQTIESCTALCASYGFGVAGLEYGNECYCGVQEDLEGALVSGECYMPCAGDSSEICGGPNALNVYVNPDITPRTVQLPAGWTTYGVVSEGQNGRLLPVQLYSSADNTNAKCANDCAAQGYSISGTEYSSECFCGNAFSSAANGGELLDDSAAFMKCAGDLAESCGGPSILSISSAFGDNIPFA